VNDLISSSLQDEVLSLEEILAEGSPLGSEVSSTTQADVHSSFATSGNGKRSANDATAGLNSRLSKTQLRKLQVNFSLCTGFSNYNKLNLF
jgi:hypothetical protein